MYDLRRVFAANLRRLRHERGLSQEALAHDAKVGRRYLSRIETSTTSVGLDVIEKLAWTLDVEPAKLLELPPRRPRRGASPASSAAR